MEEEKKLERRGGKREGAGRPSKSIDSKLYTFRAGGSTAEFLDRQENKTDFIKECISLRMLGEFIPATQVKDITLPFFDLGVVAGFPIPLDNNEKAQDIEILKLLCPHPESCYLIRVEGNSMIDAGIFSGDLVIVDKSKRYPSESEVAVCELNGEYTLKRFEKRGSEGWLIPANPDFPEIKINPGDSFSIWGTVTYIIHKPRE
ncbi:MAG: LexA family transcriptional regulator [Bacteroidaceae bacterium]|nr:LexA family transcriptional regulator [Bacteroidaceae bacterium]